MIYFMRHGQDDEDYIGGWSDVSLIKEGVLEVNDTAKWLKDNLEIKKIISSDVLRARETSKIVSDVLKLDVIYDSNLREQDKGLLNGMLKTEAIVKYPIFVGDVDKDVVYPQGESLRNLYNRMKIYLQKLMELDDDTLIITHRGVINIIYYILNDIDLDIDKKRFNVTTASVHELDVVNRSIRRIK